MTKNIYASGVKKIRDTITFPIRALFMQDEGRFGLPSLQDDRMCVVASFCQGKVLDVGCGPGNIFINEYMGTETGIGIDVYPYAGVENIAKDMANLPFDDCSFDTVTLIAVGGHIPKPKRVSEFKEFARVLKPGGRLVMTEGEPITQFLHHKWVHFYFRLQGKTDMDSERGMEKDEEYCMPEKEIQVYLNTPPLKLICRKRLISQWGLNNVYIAEKD